MKFLPVAHANPLAKCTQLQDYLQNHLTAIASRFQKGIGLDHCDCNTMAPGKYNNKNLEIINAMSYVQYLEWRGLEPQSQLQLQKCSAKSLSASRLPS